MPDWTNYYAGYITEIFVSSDPYITLPPNFEQHYEEYRREREKHDQIYDLQMEEERQLIKDKEKYPLFFLKEGIV